MNLNKRYAKWAYSVCIGKLFVSKVKEWLTLGEYQTWEREYLVPAQKLKQCGVLFENLIKDLKSLKMSEDKIRWYTNTFDNLRDPAVQKLINALYDKDPLGRFRAFINDQKRLLEKAPEVIKPLIQKNVSKYESYEQEYVNLNKSIEDTANMLAEYAGLHLLNLIGIL